MNHSLRKFYAVLLPLFLFLIHLPFVFANKKPVLNTENITEMATEITTANKVSASLLYTNLNLGALGLSETAFDYAVKGYNQMLDKGLLNNDQILTIVDFSLPSSEKRFFVIDVLNSKVLYHTYVAHGRNSGTKFASDFSNKHESFKSSLGFYVTKGTYSGKHGFSLRLDGKEKGINDNAMSRAIVMHSADYVNPKLIKTQGYIGRSLGCPALPRDVYKPIIQTIKDGSCLFIYSPANDYVSRSKMLQTAS